ncbi:MAG: hypothetical protein PHW04_18340 [Candidatus Wallbacteria bacterium]|nr:hypothetical protein [Candidatus Wallbacteria bacterium]
MRKQVMGVLAAAVLSISQAPSQAAGSLNDMPEVMFQTEARSIGIVVKLLDTANTDCDKAYRDLFDVFRYKVGLFEPGALPAAEKLTAVKADFDSLSAKITAGLAETVKQVNVLKTAYRDYVYDFYDENGHHYYEDRYNIATILSTGKICQDAFQSCIASFTALDAKSVKNNFNASISPYQYQMERLVRQLVWGLENRGNVKSLNNPGSLGHIRILEAIERNLSSIASSCRRIDSLLSEKPVSLEKLEWLKQRLLPLLDGNVSLVDEVNYGLEILPQTLVNPGQYDFSPAVQSVKIAKDAAYEAWRMLDLDMQGENWEITVSSAAAAEQAYKSVEKEIASLKQQIK